MEFKTDNRWSAGGLDTKVPETAVAAYGARWLDMGDLMLADVLPDRQGFAYNDPADRDKLIACMEQAHLRILPGDFERDVDTLAVVAEHVGFYVWMRRAGGYVYVCAWLEDF